MPGRITNADLLPLHLPHIAEYTGVGVGWDRSAEFPCVYRYLVLSSENNSNRNVATFGEALVASAVKCHPDAFKKRFQSIWNGS